MTNTERTQHMTDAEVLEDLKAQRRQRKTTPQLPVQSWSEAVLWIFAIIGFFSVLTILAGLLHLH